MKFFGKILILSTVMCLLAASTVQAQILSFEDFGAGPYPGPPLPAGQTTYPYNSPGQPAVFPNYVSDGQYVIANNTQEAYVNWADLTDHTTGSGYMMIVNADANQSGEFYRQDVALPPNADYDFFGSFYCCQLPRRL